MRWGAVRECEFSAAVPFQLPNHHEVQSTAFFKRFPQVAPCLGRPNVSGKQRVWLAVYPPAEERRVRHVSRTFEDLTLAAVHGGHQCFPNVLSHLWESPFEYAAQGLALSWPTSVASLIRGAILGANSQYFSAPRG